MMPVVPATGRRAVPGDMFMWLRLHRRRGLLVAAVSLGMCFQLSSCAQEAQLTALRIGFSSITLPFNQAIFGLFNFASSLIASTIADAVTGGS
jgi:hypothetical protein